MKRGLMAIALAGLLWACSDDDELSGTRYVDDVFSEVNITFDVVYGAGAPLIGNELPLFMDIYEPVGDNSSIRPTIVLAHGGAFITGSKSQIRGLCEAYARKGYTVASIGYRLINDPTITDKDSVAFSAGVVLSISDMKGAIRYLRNDALSDNNYHIDPNLIFAGGVSAGAIMANHIGYLDDTDPAIPDYLRSQFEAIGGIEGNTNDIVASSEVSGVISFSGSLFRDAWIDSNDPPLFLVHEEGDPVVPCGYGASDLFPFPIFAYGGCELASQSASVNVTTVSTIIEGSTSHVGYFSDPDSEIANSFIDESAQFLATIINQ